jgi:hypothetical protein
MLQMRKIGRRDAALRTALRGLILGVALVGLPGVALAVDTGPGKTAAGITAYLGVAPAATVRGHSPPHTELDMHGGAPSHPDSYHLMVAVFDAKTGARIEDAKVRARVSELTLAGPKVTLEPMRIADTITYGNYVKLPGRIPYRIDVDVQCPQGTAKFQFYYTPAQLTNAR